MMTQRDILDAISELVAQKIPRIKRIYTDLVPHGFLRPCLLMQAVTESQFAVNCKTIGIRSFFTLTVFDTTDDYSHSDTHRLLDLQQELLGLFRSGILRVGNRALNVQASTGGRDWDKAYVDVQTSYYDDRDATPDTTPLIENVAVNQHLKG